MPTYHYQCPVCGEDFEKQLHFNEDTAAVTCPNGHSKVERVYSAPAVVFKGRGFYTTDSRTKSRRSEATAR